MSKYVDAARVGCINAAGYHSVNLPAACVFVCLNISIVK